MNNTSVVHISKDVLLDSSTNVPSKTEVIVWCSVFSLLSVLIVAGNLLTIVLFAVNKNLRKKSLFLAINMAFADLILGALALPLYICITCGMGYFQLWTRNAFLTWNYSLYLFYTVYFASVAASLLSATFISCERFYAIYRPFKHRTLTVRKYRVVIFTVWTLSALDTSSSFLIPFNLKLYSRCLVGLILILIICGCNIAIWRKFQQGSVALQQQNRNLRNARLTKTLLFVAILALLCWLPLLIISSLRALRVSIPLTWYFIALFFNFLNAVVNPIVYILKIPDFRQALAQYWVRRRADVNMENGEIRNNETSTLTPAQMRTLQADTNQFEDEYQDTKL